MSTTVTLTKAAYDVAQIDLQIKSLEGIVKTLKAQRSKLSAQLLEDMTEEGAPRVSVATEQGEATVGFSWRFTAGPAPELSQDEFAAMLEGTSFDSLVERRVLPSRLASFCKEQIELYEEEHSESIDTSNAEDMEKVFGSIAASLKVTRLPRLSVRRKKS